MANKKNQNQEYTKYYSHIIVNTTKRAGFSFLFSFLFLLMVGVISGHLLTVGSSWHIVILPLCMLGLPIIFYPLVEHWVYRPWQAKAQKYERHYRD